MRPPSAKRALNWASLKSPRFRDFKDTINPFFESDTLFLEWLVCIVFSCLAIFESRDVLTVPSNSILGIPYRVWMRLSRPKAQRLAVGLRACITWVHQCSNTSMMACSYQPDVLNPMTWNMLYDMYTCGEREREIEGERDVCVYASVHAVRP